MVATGDPAQAAGDPALPDGGGVAVDDSAGGGADGADFVLPEAIVIEGAD